MQDEAFSKLPFDQLMSERTLVRFYQALDASDYEACLDCFVQDGSWTRLGVEHVGRKAIEDVLRSRPRELIVRHVLSNVLADEGGQVKAYVTVYTHRLEGMTASLPAPMKPPIGLYAITAEVRGQEDGFRIERLTMAAQFYSPQARSS